MKTILVATDFSQQASKAIEFALHLSRNTRAEVIIFHAYRELDGNNYFLKNGHDVPRKDAETALEMILKTIQHDPANKDLFVWTLCVKGDFISQLYHSTQELNIDLIVTAMDGEKNHSEASLGNKIRAFTNIMTRCPVVFVPSCLKQMQVHTIAFTVDKQVNNPTTLNKLTRFASLFKAKIQLLDISGNKSFSGEVEMLEKFEQGLRKQLKQIRLTFPLSATQPGTEVIAPVTAAFQANMLGIILQETDSAGTMSNYNVWMRIASQNCIPLLAIDPTYFLNN